MTPPLIMAVAGNQLFQVLRETESIGHDLLVVGDPIVPYTLLPYTVSVPHTGSQLLVVLSLMLGSEQ